MDTESVNLPVSPFQGPLWLVWKYFLRVQLKNCRDIEERKNETIEKVKKQVTESG